MRVRLLSLLTEFKISSASTPHAPTRLRNGAQQTDPSSDGQRGQSDRFRSHETRHQRQTSATQENEETRGGKGNHDWLQGKNMGKILSINYWILSMSEIPKSSSVAVTAVL
jgi:hypothetical protein